ncbi:MAG: SpoIIE family protein phosphatase [Clostridia bacterium]
MNMEQLKESKVFLQSVMDSIPSPLFIIDANNRVESLNQSFLSFFNQKDKEMTGMLTGNAICCASLEEGEECGSTEYCVECVLRESIHNAVHNDIFVDKQYFNKSFRINDKTIRKTLRFSIRPLKYDHERFFLCMFDDVTEEYMLEEQLGAQNEKIKMDIFMARGIQTQLLPKKEQIGRLSLSYVYRPCETLGGDFIGYYPINRRYTGIIIADVSGHGLVSSMFTVFLFSIIDRSQKTPKRILESMYQEFSRFNVEPEMYITLLCAVFDNRTDRITFANAGFANHPAVISDKGLQTIPVNGIPISNWMEQVSYDEQTVSFRKGDRLVMFSDGISELWDKDRGFVGTEYLYQKLSDRKKTGREVIRDTLLDVRSSFQTEIRDDITVLVVDHEGSKRKLQRA